MENVKNSSAPNLIVAAPMYDKRQMDQFANQLRLYFTVNDGVNRSLINAALSSSVMGWLSEGSF